MITSVYGKFLLVVVNMKKNSKNYLKHKKWIIDYKKPTLILIPPYYANGHLCLSMSVYFIINGVIKENILMLANKTVTDGMIQN